MGILPSALRPPLAASFFRQRAPFVTRGASPFAVPIEIERIVAPALPWLRLGAGAALIARFGRAREREKSSSHTAETDRRPVRSVPGFARISAIVSVRRDHRRIEGAPKNAISNSNDRRELRAL